MIEMQKKVAKMESQLKDINDDLNTVCDRLDELERRVSDLARIVVGMTIEEDEEIGKENEDGKQ